MTPSQLSAIRENVSFDAVSIHDVIPLLAEVERLTAERDAAFRRGAEAMREARESVFRDSLCREYDDSHKAAAMEEHRRRTRLLARINAALAAHRDEVPAQDSATGFVEPKESDWTLLSNHAGIIVALLPNDEMLSIRPETDKYGTMWAWSYGGLVKTEAEARRAATAAARGMR